MTWKTFFKENRAWNVFSWQMRRVLPIGALYWAAFLLACLYDHYTNSSEHLAVVNALSIGFAFLLPPWLFADCFGRRQADFFHALPIKRGEFFCGSFLAGLCSLWAPILPFMAFRDWIYGPVEFNRSFWPMVLIMALMGASVLAFFTLAAVCSGTYFEYGLTAALLTFGWLVMAGYMVGLINRTIPGAQSAYFPAEYLSRAGCPPFALFLSHMRGRAAQWDMAHQLPLTTGLGLALGGLSFWVYVRRPSEHSGLSRKNKGMALYLRVQLALTAAVGFGYAAACRAFDISLGDKGIPFTLGAIVLSLLGVWAVTEVYYTRSLKKLHRHWLPLLLSFLVTAGVVGAISTGLGLDTQCPDPEILDGVSLSRPGGHEESFSVNPADAEYARLYACAQSPENLEKVRQLQAKWIEAERASQYPYLPGRNSYMGWDQEHYASFTYIIKPWERYHSYLFYYLYYEFQSKTTPEAQAKLEEFEAMRTELVSDEEYVDGLFPLNTLDALEKIEKGNVWNNSIIEYNPDFFTDSQLIEDFPKDFPGKLEEALREDFGAGRFSTSAYLQNRTVDSYRLCISGHRAFTAKGGLLSVGWPEYVNKPAKGRRLYLGYEMNTVSYVVTPEMESTYALLQKEYRKG